MTAKKKKEDDITSPINQLAVVKSVTQSLMKEFKDSETVRIYDGADDLLNISEFIKTNIVLLDDVLGGRGFPCGRISEIYGEPSAGKTAIATYALIDTINRGGLAVYLDTEAAYSFELAARSGLDRKGLVYLTPKTLEDIYRSIEKIIDHVQNEAPRHLVTIVVDSIAATPSQNELENDIDKAEMGERAKINSKGLRKITQLIGDNNICLLLVNQTRTKFVLFGDPEFVPGGSAIDFHSTIKLKVKKGKDIEASEKDKTVIGQKMKILTTKNKIADPKRNAEIELFFDTGIPKYSGVFEWLVKGEILRRYGQSFFYKNPQGEEIKYLISDFDKFIEEHPILLDKKQWKVIEPEKLDI